MIYVYWLVGIIFTSFVGKWLYEYLKKNSELKSGLKGKVANADDYYRLRDEVLNTRIGTEYFDDRFFVALDPNKAMNEIAKFLAKIGFPDIKRERAGANNNIMVVFAYEGRVYRLCFILDVSVWLSGEMPLHRQRWVLADISSYINSYQNMTKTQRIVRAAEEELSNGMV